MKQIDDITWQSNDGLITFKNMDCNEFMAGCKDNEFDLNLSDPPYGCNWGGVEHLLSGDTKKTIELANQANKWDIKPSENTFNLIKKSSKKQLIFGYNYLTDILGNTNNLIVWDKEITGMKYISRFEMIYSSFNVSEIIKIDSKKTDKFHPTQKPIQIYLELIERYTKPTDTILDCFGGSMSNAIACHMKRRKLTIIEIDSEYFASALLRFSEYEQKVEDIKEFGYAKTKINAQNPVLF